MPYNRPIFPKKLKEFPKIKETIQLGFPLFKETIRTLDEASKEFKQTQNIIVTLDEEWITDDGKIQVLPLWKFLLEES